MTLTIFLIFVRVFINKRELNEDNRFVLKGKFINTVYSAN